ncbi:Anti-adapter protein iraP [Citrobacter freundii]|nr:Anti-adapter protein iraP [Citrobacter freundii]
MKNLVTELLLKLAQKEEESQDLAVQVETLERVIIEMPAQYGRGTIGKYLFVKLRGRWLM